MINVINHLPFIKCTKLNIVNIKAICKVQTLLIEKNIEILPGQFNIKSPKPSL